MAGIGVVGPLAVGGGKNGRFCAAYHLSPSNELVRYRQDSNLRLIPVDLTPAVHKLQLSKISCTHQRSLDRFCGVEIGCRDWGTGGTLGARSQISNDHQSAHSTRNRR